MFANGYKYVCVAYCTANANENWIHCKLLRVLKTHGSTQLAYDDIRLTKGRYLKNKLNKNV